MRRHFGSPIAANGHDTIARSRPALPMSAPRAAKALDRGAFPGRSSSRGGRNRSEEHTSELQSLMRISYAVFCLKKKKNNQKADHDKDLTRRIIKREHTTTHNTTYG